MKHILFTLSIIAIVFGMSCEQAPDTNTETNPFVGTWETLPDGTVQDVFTADGKIEYRSFSLDTSLGKYKLVIHRFGTYTYEGRKATIELDMPGYPAVFDIDVFTTGEYPLWRKTNNPMITDWLPQ